MHTTLLLIRHGETEWNTLGKFQGCKDINLTEEGIFQATLLNKKIQNSFDYIYTSPLKRAIDTSNIICANSSLKPEIYTNLREINFGKWEGLTLNEMKKLYPKEFQVWRNDDKIAPLCGGDLSLKLASLRAKKAILDIIEKHKSKRIVVVTHGGLIRAGLIGLFDWKMTMYHKIVLGNTSITKLKFDENLNPFIVTLNDTSHLPKNYTSKSLT
ncbi:histidine phosphatase family protein [Haloimpatiens sp. FM7315]|uniref:histidine phosphatase family protein n=1 Tax=Haloimpatiens sp. FM7315 TaxID=3298609 RepID=UPI0035A36214